MSGLQPTLHDTLLEIPGQSVNVAAYEVPGGGVFMVDGLAPICENRSHGRDGQRYPEGNEMPKPRGKPLLLSLLIVLLGFSLGFALRAAAQPQYARLTELPCMACHESASGGGNLTRLGEAFKESEHQWPLPQEPLPSPFISLSDAVRVILRVLHLAAVASWLGAIVVIHLVIGPQVVGRGIPRKYIRLGLPAMAILLV